MIEVGDYIRTKDGIIGKAIKVLSNSVFLDNLGYAVLIKDIVKHDKNLIDLVEVGDYVNGYKVLDIMEDMNTGEIHLEMVSSYTNKEKGDCTIYNNDINTILTHELYEKNCYKVGGKDELYENSK